MVFLDALAGILIVIGFVTFFLYLATRNPRQRELLAKYQALVTDIETEIYGKEGWANVNVGIIRQKIEQSGIPGKEVIR